VKYIGFSEWPIDKIKAAAALPNVTKFISSQPQYSMLWRAPEAEVIPWCAKHGVSQIVWSPLAQGVLTGKYKPGAAPPKDSRAANNDMNGFMGGPMMSDTVLKAVQDLGPIAKEEGLSIAQLALAWVLREPNVASAIIGASRPEQVKENAAAAGHKLREDTLARIDRVLQPALEAA
jgi:aryl-alcohol dehydrogenase-like predicted oxidoreductase